MLSETVIMNAQGRIVIPKKIRDELGWKANHRINITLDEHGLRFQSLDSLLEEMRAELRQSRPEGVSLVDELLAERRENAKRENAEIDEWLSS